MIYFTMREIHTIIRNQEAPITTNSSLFIKAEGNKPPRFDKILQQTKYSQNPRSRSTMQKGNQGLEIHQELAELLKGRDVMTNIYPQAYDPKQYKLDFLRGQPSKITNYCELKGMDLNKSSYNNTFQNKFLSHKRSKPVGESRHYSYALASMSPDPVTLTSLPQRLQFRNKDPAKPFYNPKNQY